MDIQRALGGRIKELRKERKLALKEVAPSGRSVAWLSRVERGIAGKKAINIVDLVEIAARLGVEPADLLDIGTTPPPRGVREGTTMRRLLAMMETRSDLVEQLEAANEKYRDRPAVLAKVMRNIIKAWDANLRSNLDSAEAGGSPP